MIVGQVTQGLEATINLNIARPKGEGTTQQVVIDTGFDGELSLHRSIVEALALDWVQYGVNILADGSRSNVEMFSAIIEWDGEPRRVLLDATDGDSLIGMGLLRGFRLSIDAVPGGNVSILRLSPTNHSE